MLAAALAHEAAHAILGRGAHARSGLIRASWEDQEFRLIRGSVFVFSSSEGEAIRQELHPASGQSREWTTPAELLTTDSRAFAQWLETAGSTPLTAQAKARALSALPSEVKSRA